MVYYQSNPILVLWDRPYQFGPTRLGFTGLDFTDSVLSDSDLPESVFLPHLVLLLASERSTSVKKTMTEIIMNGAQQQFCK